MGSGSEEAAVYIDETLLRPTKVAAARSGKREHEILEEALRKHLGLAKAVEHIWFRHNQEEPPSEDKAARVAAEELAAMRSELSGRRAGRARSGGRAPTSRRASRSPPSACREAASRHVEAIHLDQGVGAVVVSVPGNVVAGGLPSDGPAWILDGRALPWVDDAGSECREPSAVIPAERVPGPIALVSAGADSVWPSAAMALAVSERLRSHGDPHGHVLLK